jgi:uncharacterized protein (TIGR00369 family)
MNTVSYSYQATSVALHIANESAKLAVSMSKSSQDHVDAIREYATQGLAAHIGIEIVELSRERVVATMPVDDRTRQPYGLLHGGASVALAETVASIAAIANIDPNKFRAVGLEINANHIRAKTEGRVTGTATPIHIGRSTHVWNIQIVDEDDRLVCISRCTVAIVPTQPISQK